MNEHTLTNTEREAWPAGLRAAKRVREVLADHFVMWHDLSRADATWTSARPSGEWRCACGLKFGFSDTAIDHQASAVELIVAARVEDAVDRERERITQAIESHYLGADYGRNYDGTESRETALGHAHDEALQYAASIARGLLAADDTEGKPCTCPINLAPDVTPFIHSSGCSWETGPYCNCGTDPARALTEDKP